MSAVHFDDRLAIILTWHRHIGIVRGRVEHEQLKDGIVQIGKVQAALTLRVRLDTRRVDRRVT